ncbi:hypothetical protein [Streptomyces sp. NPDC126503]|uniref:hypothetical protein n=1 Tax=Streptomyces sp. NPDC126503 TaxID=3155315 RepID=UPI00331D26D6
MLGLETFTMPAVRTRTPERRTGDLPRRTEGRHRRSGRRWGRWHRRIVAYRDVRLLSSPAPGGHGEECLLLVHVRRVVGRVTYRACARCAEGVITEVVLDPPFRDCGLGTRALSHLRARYPGVTWRTTVNRRLTRDLLRRMRVLRAAAGGTCPHLRPPGAGAARSGA